MTNLIVTFRNFVNVPKIDKNIIVNTVLVTYELFDIYLFFPYVISI
jgi:hypothetical protein